MTDLSQQERTVGPLQLMVSLVALLARGLQLILLGGGGRQQLITVCLQLHTGKASDWLKTAVCELRCDPKQQCGQGSACRLVRDPYTSDPLLGTHATK